MGKVCARRPSGPIAAVFAVVMALASPTSARAEGWLATHGLLEGAVGGAWRVAVPTGGQTPGFLASTIGGAVYVGVAFAKLDVLAGARLRWGEQVETGYLESAGGVAVQVRPGERLRLRLGGEAGRAWKLETPGAAAWLLDTFLETAIDLVTLGNHAAIVLTLRLDVGGFLDRGIYFPEMTMSLGMGVGARY